MNAKQTAKEFEKEANRVYQILAYCMNHTPKDGTTVFPEECADCKEQAERIRQALLAAKRKGLEECLKIVSDHNGVQWCVPSIEKDIRERMEVKDEEE